ncbi:MAG: response regulator transcription factor [Bacteroidetes bacterium]|nr:response regulator transcription factor [Bacteroidota bacterium]MBL0018912.1 response regulator transcription factor [Bacteroidota bacterium]MBP6721116.1 response regulator transcription factor [Bacteroidia bacterium]
MITCIIIDDETKCVHTLELIIQRHCPELQLLASCDSAESGLEAIRTHRPQVVFLDIEMPKMNGFDMLDKVGKIDFHVVFTTAYSQFAIKAFQYSALNYLLKPIDPDDLIDTVSRIQNLQRPPQQEQIDILLETLRRPEPKMQRIALSTHDGLIFVQTTDIMYCQSENNYTWVYLTKGGKHLLAKTLKEFEETLPALDFYRIHNSYLVNLNEIQRFVREDGGYVIMNNGTQITIARARREQFFSLFDKF